MLMYYNQTRLQHNVQTKLYIEHFTFDKLKILYLWFTYMYD